MHFLVNASDINAGMSLVSHALSARPMRQVYEGVLLETADEGLYLTCTDGEMTIRTRINATIQEEGVALMPAKLFGELLRKLSGHTHHVITGVCLKRYDKLHHFSVTSEVTFKTLSEQEISYYVEHYRPFDKAGAYGIQEWIGYIGVTGLKGSYFNVMGLPVQRIYEELMTHFSDSSREWPINLELK